MRALLTLALVALPFAAMAENSPPAATYPPLTAEEFEAIVEGKTFDTHTMGESYEVETFLPGRRTILRNANQCVEGTWRPEGQLICFDYQGDPVSYCWTYHDHGSWLKGWYNGDRTTEPIELYPIDDLVTCEGYLGA
ncbi:hypothetical protein [Tabrizicola sp.]|uniref:hypothetical protein n=1 Tax=Tabrizicola sp. TaxID=2005166 RepID=UPI003F35E89F